MKTRERLPWAAMAIRANWAIIKGLAVLVLCTTLAMGFLSCKTDSEDETVYRTVTYSTEHGSAPEKLTVEDGTVLASLPQLSGEVGYTFDGWYDGATKVGGGYKVTKDVTLKAKWTANTYTVTLNDNGSTITVTATYGQVLSDLESIPSLDGSTFGGYYTKEFAKGTKYIGSDGKGCAEWNLTEDTTLYAAWGYSITYKNTKDAQNTNPEFYTGEESVELTKLEKAGYTFNGWFDAETDGSEVTSIAQGSTGAKTLYARWTIITYTITYEGLGGVTTGVSYTVESDTITLQNPTRAGYIFSGWFDAETGGNKVESIAQGSTGDKIIYAQWKPITYTITYEGLGGVENPNTVTSYTIESDTITLKNPSKTGYTFAWKKGSETVTKIEKGSTGNITLTGEWTPITYTITYEGLGGVENPNTVTSYTIESDTITLQNPIKGGYIFAWMNGLEEVSQIEKGSAGDITLTGSWRPITYTITYEGLSGAENPNTVNSYTVESDTIILQNPTRTAYTFSGWYDAESGGDKVESIPKGSTGEKTFYARWTPITYTITYVAEDGTKTYANYTIESDTIILPKQIKDGYTFAWLWDEKDEKTQIEKGSTGDISLYGTWTPITYTITYVLPEEVTNPNTVTTYTIESDTITLQALSRDDYTFSGWYDAESGGNKVESIPQGSTGSKTLYARFEWKWIGPIAPKKQKAVGDIVFNDGSAMTYSDFAALDDEAKNTKKASAIALIFYRGSGLNSGDDTTTIRTLGVGLKQGNGEWCLTDADACAKDITAIKCYKDENSGAITGDRNGSDNLEQIEAFEGIEDTATEANYPAFYYAKNYAKNESRIAADSEYAVGWYLPSIAELFQIYKCSADTTNGFDIDAASEALGGDKFGTSWYWSSSQSTSVNICACYLEFENGKLVDNFWEKGNEDGFVCAIREFN